MPTTDEFTSFYENHLKLKLMAYEKQRQSIIRKFLLVFILCSLLIVFAGLAIIILFRLDNEICSPQLRKLMLFAALITIIIITIELVLFYKRITYAFQTNFKKGIIGNLVRFVDENFSYNPEREISLQTFQTSQLFKRFYGKKVDRWTGEDYIEGNLGQTVVKFSEIHLQKKGDDSFYTLFDGLFFIIHFNQAFEGVILVLPNDAKRRQRRFRWWLRKQSYHHPIKLATPELEQAFLAYSDNPMMAGYILSTDFMSHLLAWHRRLKKPVFLSFVNDKLYMAINVEKDLFEPPIFHTVLNFGLIQKFFENIQFGKTMVKDLRQSLKEPIIT
jgi:hypothetical protein